MDRDFALVVYRALMMIVTHLRKVYGFGKGKGNDEK